MQRLLGDGATLDTAVRLGLGDLVELECRVAYVLEQLSAYGLAVDVPLARELLDRWTREKEAIDGRHPGVNFESNCQVGALLASHGVVVSDTRRESLEPHAP
jgi:hypothetical protein